MRRVKACPGQGLLFGYISPVTGTVLSHPPLCACGECPMPVEKFGPQPAVELAETVGEPWLER